MSMKPLCDRCGITRGGFKMSMFNKDWCCELCITVESNHPNYADARASELEAVKAGVKNYDGIGLPEDYSQWAKEQRLHLATTDEKFLLLMDGLTNED